MLLHKNCSKDKLFQKYKDTMNSLSSVYLLLSYNLYRANIFSMPWKSVILLCKSESASNILSLNFESGEISLRFFFFNMKIFFYQLHCLWDIFTICHFHFPHRCWEIHLYLFPLAAYLESWKMTVDIPLIIYSLSPPMLELNFTFSVITFCFIMTFSSLLTSPSFDQTIF